MSDHPTLTLSIDGAEVSVDGSIKGDPNNRELFSGAWKWSRSLGAWVLPRNLKPLTREGYVIRFKADCERLGYPLDVDDTGAVQTETERREAREERLDARADRYEDRAEKLAAESDSRSAAARAILDYIPMGQPILVGHHSERGHRAALRRVDGHMSKAVETGRAAERAERLAAGIRRHLDSGDAPVTVKRRITRTATELRDIERRAADATDGSEYQQRMQREADRLREAIDLDNGILDSLVEQGRTRRWGPADFRPGDRVAHRFGWQDVVKVNKVTVALKTEYTWTDKLPYDDVLGRLRDGEILRDATPRAAAG